MTDRRIRGIVRRVKCVVPVVLALLATSATACVERDSPRRVARARGPTEPPVPRPTPASVDAQHVVPQASPTTLAVVATDASFAEPAAIAPDGHGGAWAAWAAGPAATRVVFAHVGPDGRPGPTWEAGSAREAVRELTFAVRGSDALVVWNGEPRARRSRIVAQRLRDDGARVGGPFTIGLFLLDGVSFDAGTAGDRLGLAVRVVASPGGFAVGFRGPPMPCGSQACATVRVAEVDLGGIVAARGGVDLPDPSRPMLLVGTSERPWSAAVAQIDGATASTHTFGRGALGALQLPAGRGPWAAWESAERAYVLTWSRAGMARDNTVELFSSAPVDAGIPAAARRVDSLSVVCDRERPVVRIVAAGAVLDVHPDDPGSESAFALAMAQRASVRGLRVPGIVVAANAAPAQQSGSPVAAVGLNTGVLVHEGNGTLRMARCVRGQLGPTLGVW